MAIVNNGNTNGSAVLGVVTNICPISYNGVIVSNGSIAGLPRCGETGFLNHIFRSPVANATTSVRVLRGLTLTSHHKGFEALTPNISGGRGRRCGRLLGSLSLNLRAELASGINLLSNNRERTVALLVTALGGPGILLLSRRATTLSPGATRGILGLAASVITRRGLAALVVARGVGSTVTVNGELVVVGRNGVVCSITNRRGGGLAPTSLLRGFGVADNRRLSGSEVVLSRWFLVGRGERLTSYGLPVYVCCTFFCLLGQCPLPRAI